MKSFKRSLVQNTLKELGFSRSKGNASGHETWRNQEGKSCRPVFRKRDVCLASAYSLGQELQNKGVISRKQFIDELKANHRR